MGDYFLTTEQAAAKAGCSNITIQRWCFAGKIKAMRPGKRWLIYPEQFNDEPDATIWELIKEDRDNARQQSPTDRAKIDKSQSKEAAE